MKEHHISLTTPEIAGLWKTYMQNTSNLCVFKHFEPYIQDSEIKPLVIEQINLLQKFTAKITEIFSNENFPVPQGFSDEDINLSAPALYTDLYGLSYVYRFNQIVFSDYAVTITKVARTDVVEFFYECLNLSGALFKKALTLMLSKGIYDRPPKMPYPHQVEFIKKRDSLIETWFGEHRPLNAMELGEIFYIIERNYIGILMLMGFIQVMQDREIKDYLLKGKDLAEKQIDIFNKILKDEEHLGNMPVSMEVTDSTVSPFSDKLIMFLISTSASAGIYLCAYAMSLSMRKDLAVHYAALMVEISRYGEEGMKLMIERGWMEQPPESFDRAAFQH
ncbi:sugar isomerase [Desulfosporosinus sp. HMP52]|uniref:DUF3231 family protein n=1 Tax=Desulfosporosinus sp. HMP52 TaxID=1487923 RepID=UPI00051F93CB|nr:DUF3231 family protein [Desulfosporosinus sp. HMP52]KGK92035.1 sugar isomerase [Desulfosporosinus sp. HMP52]